jgi:cellulose synthase/poly-beta-1,6-N-acetylglucosamine synthase-like glycosyltransferase
MSTAIFAYTPVFTPKEPFVVHRSSSYTPRHIDRTAEARYEKIPTSYDRRDASGTLQATPVKPTREFHKRKLALLLPGHNEELIIAHTIQSAIIAGQNIRDIYVVNDASTDRTKQIATELLGKDNVLTVKRSGKALAVQKAVKRFKIEKRYTWLHIADADSIFSPEYFREYRKKLDENKYAVAVGFVQSLRGNWISTYRALTYIQSAHQPPNSVEAWHDFSIPRPNHLLPHRYHAPT